MLRTALSMIEGIRVPIEVVATAIEIVCRAVEAVCGSIEMIAIDDGRAVGNVGIVVVDDCPVSPITSPAVPAPGETSQEAEPKA
jgi:ribose 5-phosphate isomerase